MTVLDYSSQTARSPRVRHHTSDECLDRIQADQAIYPGRPSLVTGQPCIHVEIEPFGPTTPTPANYPYPGRPKTDLGLREDGSYIEFDLPYHLPFFNTTGGFLGPRHTGEIITDSPLSLTELNPVFVRVRRKWYEWWRTKAELQ